MDLRHVLANGAKRCSFDFEAETRRESHRSHHAEFVFRETAAGLADGSNDFGFEVGLSAHEIEHFSRVVPHQQSVDRKVSALHIFLRGLRINDTVWVPAITVAHVRAECGNFDLQSIVWNENHPELHAHRDTLRKKRHSLLGRRIGRHVVIGGLATEKQVAHAAAHHQRLVAAATERVADRVGQFAWRHAVIMRQSGPRGEIGVFESFRERLFVPNVVGARLPRRPFFPCKKSAPASICCERPGR